MLNNPLSDHVKNQEIGSQYIKDSEVKSLNNSHIYLYQQIMKKVTKKRNMAR